jgi:hypothetical protein
MEGVTRKGESNESLDECVSLGVRSGGEFLGVILRGGGGRYRAERVGVEAVCAVPTLSSIGHRGRGD